MMLEELGLVIIDDIQALKCGIATMLAFMILGILPAIPYFISWSINRSNASQLIPVVIIGAVELFSLGMGKALMIGLNPFKSGIETLLIGAVITALGYVIGLAITGKLWSFAYLNHTFIYHSIIQHFFILLLLGTCTLNTEPPWTSVRQTSSVPVYRPTWSAYVHLLEALNWSPAKLAVWNKVFIFITFLNWRQTFSSYGLSIFSGDEKDFLAAEGTGSVSSPPFFDALKTKDVPASQFSRIIWVVTKANYALSKSDLRVVEHFGHSASDPRLYLILVVSSTKVRLGRSRESEWCFGLSG